MLRREFSRRSWAGATVAIGTSTDAYQPAEGRFKPTRQGLEVFRAYRNPLGMVPKSPLVIRDADLLADLARVAKVRIFFTVTTVDLALWRTLEPGTANPFKRLAVMGRLVSAGVPAGVLLAPAAEDAACSAHASAMSAGVPLSAWTPSRRTSSTSPAGWT